MQILRPIFARKGVLCCSKLKNCRDGAFASVAGIVLIRQRPGKGNAIFITLEDETGITNVVLWAKQLEFFRREVMGSRLMLVKGRVQKSPEDVIHLMATSLFDRSHELDRLWDSHRSGLTNARHLQMPLAYADEIVHPVYDRRQTSARHPREVKIIPKSRDFR